ncbi:MAG: EpsG family protein [Clostridiales bacterium]|nr:EpsG family protein [Clostridiales bacterium]
MYILFICVMTAEYFLMVQTGKHKNGKLAFCIVVALELILLSGLRSMYVGADTISYYGMFKEYSQMSWGELFERFVMFIKDDSNSYALRDPGYGFLVKMFTSICGSYRIYLIFIAALFHGPLMYLIYKHSKNAYVSTLIYFCLYFDFFGITGIRQTIALMLTTILCYDCFEKKKTLRVIVLSLIAFFIHKSSIMFMIFYMYMRFLAPKKVSSNYTAAALILIVLAFVFRNQIMGVAVKFLGYEQYTDYKTKTGAYVFGSVMLALLLVTIWRKNLIKSENGTVLINALFAALLLLPMAFINPTNMRITYYTNFYMILLIPEIIDTFEGNHRIFFVYGMLALLIGLYIRSMELYAFFWQVPYKGM